MGCADNCASSWCLLLLWGRNALFQVSSGLHDNYDDLHCSLVEVNRCAFEEIISMHYMVYFNFFACVLLPLLAMFVLYFLIFRVGQVCLFWWNVSNLFYIHVAKISAFIALNRKMKFKNYLWLFVVLSVFGRQSCATVPNFFQKPLTHLQQVLPSFLLSCICQLLCQPPK